jgi:hypothetical protein
VKKTGNLNSIWRIRVVGTKEYLATGNGNGIYTSFKKAQTALESMGLGSYRNIEIVTFELNEYAVQPALRAGESNE